MTLELFQHTNNDRDNYTYLPADRFLLLRIKQTIRTMAINPTATPIAIPTTFLELPLVEDLCSGCMTMVSDEDKGRTLLEGVGASEARKTISK